MRSSCRRTHASGGKINGVAESLLVPAVDLVRAGDREQAIDWLRAPPCCRSDSLTFAGSSPRSIAARRSAVCRGVSAWSTVAP